MATKNNPGEFDCYANAEPDEPFFVLLGRDVLAGDLVKEWARRREMIASVGDGPDEREARKIAEARAVAEQMYQYAGVERRTTRPEGMAVMHCSALTLHDPHVWESHVTTPDTEEMPRFWCGGVS